jgi:hypothetical protein
MVTARGVSSEFPRAQIQSFFVVLRFFGFPELKQPSGLWRQLQLYSAAGAEPTTRNV